MPTTACCDTSFLFSLYGRDAHTPRAAAAVKRLGQHLVITVFNEYELLNAIRFAVFRQLLSPAAAASIISAFEADLAQGKIVIEPCNLAQVLVAAKRLSQQHTAAAGHRSFDILHVATALHLSATSFYTFDHNQRTLAKTTGLKPLP
jgi:predicted nucleic acid-binding protein